MSESEKKAELGSHRCGQIFKNANTPAPLKLMGSVSAEIPQFCYSEKWYMSPKNAQDWTNKQGLSKRL